LDISQKEKPANVADQHPKRGEMAFKTTSVTSKKNPREGNARQQTVTPEKKKPKTGRRGKILKSCQCSERLGRLTRRPRRTKSNPPQDRQGRGNGKEDGAGVIVEKVVLSLRQQEKKGVIGLGQLMLSQVKDICLIKRTTHFYSQDRKVARHELFQLDEEKGRQKGALGPSEEEAQGGGGGDRQRSFLAGKNKASLLGQLALEN